MRKSVQATKAATQQRADQADLITNNPAYVRAKKAVEETLIAKLKGMDANPEEEGEIVRLLRCSDLFHKMLEAYLRSAEVSEMNDFRDVPL